MTLILKQIFSLIQMLNSETGTNQIASGLALGLALGFSPLFSLQGILILLVMFFFRVQMGAAFLAAFFFKFTAYLLDPVFHKVGEAVLKYEALRPIFTDLYNMPIVPWTRFFNTVIMGSGIVGLLLFVPAFFLFRWLVKTYRATVLARFQQTKFWKFVKATTFYKWYAKYDELYG